MTTLKYPVLLAVLLVVTSCSQNPITRGNNAASSPVTVTSSVQAVHPKENASPPEMTAAMPEQNVPKDIASSHLLETTDEFGVFGTVHIYRKTEKPGHVVLFISGDGGWSLGVIDMARELAMNDAMVVGIDITHYIKEINKHSSSCNYAASDFESLSQYLQKKLNFTHYIPPILVGYSSGATMVYTTLAQAPINTFSGGISLGFCPDLKTAKPFCKGNGTLTATVDKSLGYIYQPVESLVSPWVILQGDIDQVCSTPDTKVFLEKIEHAELSELPKVGHGFSVPRNWMPEFKAAYHHINELQTSNTKTVKLDVSIQDLPLVLLPRIESSDTLAIIVSGDGGWASLDKQIAEAIYQQGISVIGLNSLQYFWGHKDPEIAGKDLARLFDYYSQQWNIQHFILVGYSQGADVLPFMINRLPAGQKKQIERIALLGLEEHVDFEVHVSNWLSSADSGQYAVVPETNKLGNLPVLCIHGDEETDTACDKLKAPGARAIEMKGGHHFGGRYSQLARLILGKDASP